MHAPIFKFSLIIVHKDVESMGLLTNLTKALSGGIPFNKATPLAWEWCRGLIAYGK